MTETFAFRHPVPSPSPRAAAVPGGLRLLPGLALLICLTLALALLARPLHAEERIALVVGNGSYAEVTQLDNAVQDARLIAEVLEQTGFRVTLLTEADQVTLTRGIAQFGRALRDAGEDATGLFYYAGHGVQSFGNNYLLPVDAGLTDAADLSLVGVRADAVLRQMFSARNRSNIVILDACRDNPFESVPDMNENGLAEMKAPTGTFLAYATAPGSVALDGMGGNSPFTEALARHIPEPGLALEQLFKKVRNDVLSETNGMQTPWDTSSLTADFRFIEAPKLSPEELAARQLWDSVRPSRDPVQLLLFLRSYGNSSFAEPARALLAEVLAEEFSAPGAPAPEAAPEVAAPAPVPAPAPEAAPEPAPVATGPAPDERELIAVAQKTGAIVDYQAYLDAFPDGTYAELAAFELGILRQKAAEAAAAAPPAAPAPVEEPPAETVLAARGSGVVAPRSVTFSAPLGVGGPEIEAKSLQDLIKGSPRFPPIEGLPESVWKDKTCSNCHEWTRERLCDQAVTYLGDVGSRALGKEHPYGGVFKQSLKVWAGADCPE